MSIQRRQRWPVEKRLVAAIESGAVASEVARAAGDQLFRLCLKNLPKGQELSS
jgi:hypothetical protein